MKLKILEFLYFYLMPEAAGPPASDLSPGDKSSPPRKELRMERTTEEKQKMLGEYMSNVEGLVADLRESQPFGV